ncbi:uncharacterized protein [Littorina saxatilis]|uniref:uncharacterized protein n=1 Tax=Littorina saxatilis TaxID=31220 RepID=UPI0038B45D9E
MIPVFISLILIAAVRGQDTIIKCYVTVSPVPEGQPVEIVCDFPTSSLANKEALFVYHNTEKVVTCTFDNEAYNCDDIDPGYYISGQLINGEVRLLIPHATKRHEGNYTCKVGDITPSSCELKVTEIPFDTNCTVKRTQNGADIIFFFNKNLRLVNATIFIYKQPFDSDKNDTIVLYCLIRDRGDPKCDKNLSSFDSTRMTLHIDSTSKKDEGRYTAKVPSSSPGIFTPCDLILPSTISGKPEPISSASPIADEPYAQCADTHTTLVLLIFLLVICFLVIVGVVIVFLFIPFAFRTLRKCR